MISLYIALGVVVLLLLIFVLPGFVIIGSREVGIVVRKNFGKRLPEGHIIACNGEVGIQADVLRPGFYWRFPILWGIRTNKIIEVEPGQVGLIKSVDGKPLASSRVLGDEVECDSYQDAKMFLNNGGYRGAQIGFLRPGTYRINTSAFDVEVKKATEIHENQIGIVIANDGNSLPTGYVIAPRPVTEDGKPIADPSFFLNGQGFIKSKGYRGPQLDTLQPGVYYINTLLFNINEVPIADVPPGYVAVIRSNVGLELEKSGIGADVGGTKDLKGPVHEEIEKLLIIEKNMRGIWREPVAPGKYNLNTLAYTPYLVPTSAVTIDWAAEGKIGTEVKGVSNESVLYKFNPLKVTSKDGFQLEVNVRMVIRVRPENAAYVIARFGSVDNLIDQIVHPLIDASFRNKAGEKKAIDFFQSRTDLQMEALAHAKSVFEEYNVEAQNLLVAYIDIPQELLNTQTKKEIALQQQTQYDQEAMAQEKLIAVREKTARADKQKEVIDAKLSIDINTDKAAAMIKEAEGKKQSIVLEADGVAHKNQVEGEGIAAAYKAQAEAIGSNQVYAAIKMIEQLALNKIKIVPDTLITGGNDNSSILNWLLSSIAKKNN